LDRIKLSKLSTHGELPLDGTAAIRGGEYYYEQVKIINGGTLYVAPGEFLKIYASQIIIDSASKIFADGRGYLGGDGGIIGSGMGYGNPGYLFGGGGGGAGYGSKGGNGGEGGDTTSSEAGPGGESYGNKTLSSIESGSGGGGGGYGEGGAGTPFVGANGGDGGNGGGAILLHAEKITIAGTISADGSHGRNGAESSGKAGGGGGGGSG
ncbi:unnamed protein product, partial [marine sediment metagenome]